MRKVTLFIAMSLDGYIADANGNVDWLSGQEAGQDDMESYVEFIKEIDTVVMGYTTYHQIVTELSPGQWAYQGMTTYVLTHRELPSQKEILFTAEDPCRLVDRLKPLEGKGIWICGGAAVAGQLIAQDKIDRFHISVIPVILGDGIRLFNRIENDGSTPAAAAGIELKYIRSQTYNGITDLVYERR